MLVFSLPESFHPKATAGIIAEKLGKMAEIGLHMIVAIQNLEFNKKLLKPLLENTGLGFIFSIPKKSLRSWQSTGA
jgi:hypothetical protein